MNNLDVIILSVVGLGLIWGLFTGAIRQVASFVGLVLSLVLGTLLMHSVGALLTATLGISEKIAPAVGFVVVFAVVEILIFIVTRILEKIIGVLRLTPLNRLAGGVIGGSTAVLLVSVVLFGLSIVGVPDSSVRDQSVLYEPVTSVLPYFWRIVTERAPEAVILVNWFEGQH